MAFICHVVTDVLLTSRIGAALRQKRERTPRSGFCHDVRQSSRRRMRPLVPRERPRQPDGASGWTCLPRTTSSIEIGALAFV